MKKHFTSFLTVCLLFFTLFIRAEAQTLSPDDIAATFTKAISRETFSGRVQAEYYRFIPSIWYYDNLSLKYFPPEHVNSLKWEYVDAQHYYWYFKPVQPPAAEDWAVVGREKTGNVHQQLVYLDSPALNDVFQGLDFPCLTHLEDFYLYADLFVLDDYPENTGSCYLYFSNSDLIGNRSSHGILIDPRSGIYRMENNYDTFSTTENSKGFSGLYLLGSETHQMELLKPLDDSMYDDRLDCIGSAIYPNDDLDGKFYADLDWLRARAVDNGYNPDPAAYRIELVRLDGLTAVYINGTFVYEFEDGLITDGLSFISERTTPDMRFKGVNLRKVVSPVWVEEYEIRPYDNGTWTVYNEKEVTRNVSWTVGPHLTPGGEMVTMAIGNLYIYRR